MRPVRPPCDACTVMRNAYEDATFEFDPVPTLHPYAVFAWYARLREHHFHLIHVEREKRSDTRDTIRLR